MMPITIPAVFPGDVPGPEPKLFAGESGPFALAFGPVGLKPGGVNLSLDAVEGPAELVGVGPPRDVPEEPSRPGCEPAESAGMATAGSYVLSHEFAFGS
jgi:hypothetical protein